MRCEVLEDDHYGQTKGQINGQCMTGHPVPGVPNALFAVLFGRFINDLLHWLPWAKCPETSLKWSSLYLTETYILCVVENYCFISLYSSLISSGQLHLPPSTAWILGPEWGSPPSYMSPQRVTFGSSSWSRPLLKRWTHGLSQSIGALP